MTILDDILDFSKISAEKLEIIPVPFDIASLINDALSIVNIKAGEAGLALTAFVSGNVPPVINSDEIRIKQCLLNLLNNAVKFTKEGYVSLRISCEHIEGGLKLNFAVKDTGIGMKKTDIGKLFGIFSRLDTKKNRTIVGTGLGLAITKNLVEKMGGQISVESLYGEGSVFSFYVICEGTHEGRLAQLYNPWLYDVLVYEPNIYYSENLRYTFSELGIRHTICGTLTEFKERLKGDYTHILYDKAAITLLGSMTDIRGETMLMKDMRDAGINVASLNRPLLLTTIISYLSGATGEELMGRKSEIRLGAFQTKGVRALLVDDSLLNLTVAEGLLRKYGMEVVLAYDGQEGLDKITSEDFDIAFFDHMMPVMDGVEAAMAIRALGGKSETLPIVALTANAMSGSEDLFLEAGMDAFLAKPIIIKELHHILLKLLPPEKIISGAQVDIEEINIRR
jgi:CheY-like chemotaxis protein